MEADRGLGDRPPGVDQGVEHLAGQQTAVDDAHAGDLDDAVAAPRVEPGGLGVEHDVAELRQRALEERARLPAARQQVEVVELGPRRQGLREARPVRVRARRPRQRQAHPRMPRPGMRLAPDLAAMMAQHVAQPPAAVRPGLERLVEPGLERAERERRTRPDQIEGDPPALVLDLEIEAGHSGRPPDRACQAREQQAEVIAVAVQPETGADRGQRQRLGVAGETAVDPADQVGAVQIGARPVAGGQLLGGCGERLELGAERGALALEHAQERRPLGRGQGVGTGQNLGGRAQRRGRRALRLDQLAEPGALPLATLELQRGIDEVEDEAAGRAIGAMDQGHAAAQQAGAIGGRADELHPLLAGGAGDGRVLLVAQQLEGMGDRLVRDQAIERPVEAEIGIAGEHAERGVVEQQDAAIGRAGDQAIGQIAQHRFEAALLLACPGERTGERRPCSACSRRQASASATIASASSPSPWPSGGSIGRSALAWSRRRISRASAWLGCSQLPVERGPDPGLGRDQHEGGARPAQPGRRAPAGREPGSARQDRRRDQGEAAEQEPQAQPCRHPRPEAQGEPSICLTRATSSRVENGLVT